VNTPGWNGRTSVVTGWLNCCPLRTCRTVADLPASSIGAWKLICSTPFTFAIEVSGAATPSMYSIVP
jgi:hypothetical protein